MLQLHARTDTKWDEEPLVLRICTNPCASDSNRSQEAFLCQPAEFSPPSGFRVYLSLDKPPQSHGAMQHRRWCQLPPALSYLAEGDIIRLSPSTGHLSVLYRKASRFNSLLLTERCNSNCLMCSQPPKEMDDGYLVDIYLEAIPLMDRGTVELGLTGGEPTLLGPRLLELIQACKDYLPETALHMLSNGRMFNYLTLCEAIQEIEHPDLVIGIPLYSDVAWRHDFVVQARRAFDQTIRGLMNLERCGTRIELRVVVHQQTYQRLPQLAHFIARNLPFVEHVALMGLEMMGFVRMNLEALWIDPVDYQQELAEAVKILDQAQMTVSIYNHQLCTLDRELWPFARQSISDWKNEYLEECQPCSVRSECGGLFASAKVRHSKHIQAIPEDTRSQTSV